MMRTIPLLAGTLALVTGVLTVEVHHHRAQGFVAEVDR